MPLPRNHGKSVEYNIPLELFLHVSLHVIVRSVMHVAVPGKKSELEVSDFIWGKCTNRANVAL